MQIQIISVSAVKSDHRPDNLGILAERMQFAVTIRGESLGIPNDRVIIVYFDCPTRAVTVSAGTRRKIKRGFIRVIMEFRSSNKNIIASGNFLGPVAGGTLGSDQRIAVTDKSVVANSDIISRVKE